MQRRNFLKSCAASLAALSVAPHLRAQTTATAPAPKPNVVFILADDVGYGDLGCYGAKKIKTPHIDKLANEGRLFTDAHSPSAVCTPSRYGILTGTYPFRYNNNRGIWAPLIPTSKLLIKKDTLTLGKMMQSKGYKTACFGKWHLGFGQTKADWNKPLKPGPLECGFNYYFGIPVVNSSTPYVWVENHHIVGGDPSDPFVPAKAKEGLLPTPTQIYPAKSPNRYSGAKKAHELYKDDESGITLVQKTVAWLDKNKTDPFFIYFATPHIHHPFTPNEKYKDTSQCGRYGDFVQEFDGMVGELLTYLDKNNLRDNTIVVLTSDNGGMLNLSGQKAWEMGHRLNGDLLGFKFGAWEGGHRVPYIVRWPGHIQSGTTSDQLISSIDMFATLAKLVQYPLTEKDAPDSYNMLDSWTGNPTVQIRDQFVICPRVSSHMGLRMGDWVYIPKQGAGGWPADARKWGRHIISDEAASPHTKQKNSDLTPDGRIRSDAPPAQLYNLKDDPQQTKNVYREHTDVVTRMTKKLKEIRQIPRSRPIT